jgi:TRAP transporter T-component
MNSGDHSSQRRLGPHGLVAASLVLLSVLPAVSAKAEDSARASYEAGRNSQDKATRERLFAQGMSIAKARLDGKPDDAEGLYWLAVNMGAHALERGKMSALPVVPRMEALLLRLDQVAPTYESAGAARVLGRLYHQAPAVISVGSNKEARRFLDRAIRLAPTHPGNLAFAADFQVSHGDRATARAYAERCLAGLAGKPWSPEEREWAELALAVLERTR